MTQNLPADLLNETRLLLNRMMCELKGCIDAERMKLHPNEYLIEEWEMRMGEFRADRDALDDRSANSYQPVLGKYSAVVRGVRCIPRRDVF